MVWRYDKAAGLTVDVEHAVLKPYVAGTIDEVNSTVKLRVIPEATVVCSTIIICILIRACAHIVKHCTVS